jgi:hypothetical protein
MIMKFTQLQEYTMKKLLLTLSLLTSAHAFGSAASADNKDQKTLAQMMALLCTNPTNASPSSAHTAEANLKMNALLLKIIPPTDLQKLVVQQNALSVVSAATAASTATAAAPAPTTKHPWEDLNTLEIEVQKLCDIYSKYYAIAQQRMTLPASDLSPLQQAIKQRDILNSIGADMETHLSCLPIFLNKDAIQWAKALLQYTESSKTRPYMFEVVCYCHTFIQQHQPI